MNHYFVFPMITKKWWKWLLSLHYFTSICLTHRRLCKLISRKLMRWKRNHQPRRPIQKLSTQKEIQNDSPSFRYTTVQIWSRLLPHLEHYFVNVLKKLVFTFSILPGKYSIIEIFWGFISCVFLFLRIQSHINDPIVFPVKTKMNKMIFLVYNVFGQINTRTTVLIIITIQD